MQRVIVAADGEEIADAVAGFGGEVVLTEPSLPSGTDRVAAAVERLALDRETDLVANVQGDEPEIEPQHVGQLFELLETDQGSSVATLALRRGGAESTSAWTDQNRVKVVQDEAGRALYFSRSALPNCRGDGGAPPAQWFQHLGIYCFRIEALEAFASRPPGRLEVEEGLEQLRFLEMGMGVRVGVVESAASGIDTEEDYLRFVEQFRSAVAGRGGLPRPSGG